LTGPNIFVTDNPKADKHFFTQNLESLADQQQIFDSESDEDQHLVSSVEHSVYDDAKVMPQLSNASKINQAVNTLRYVLKYNLIGVDCKWHVTLDIRGMPTFTGAFALIQISYLDSNEKTQVLLI